jgi:hypothetical protein
MTSGSLEMFSQVMATSSGASCRAFYARIGNRQMRGLQMTYPGLSDRKRELKERTFTHLAGHTDLARVELNNGSRYG